jgi:DNA-directed RNA polymerase specialized sigma24 family protein
MDLPGRRELAAAASPAGHVERRLRHDPPPPVAPPAVESELWNAVRALPVRQRTAVALRYVCDLPQEQIAEVMHIAVGTVSATLTAARKRLAAEVNRLEVPLD